MKLTPQLYYFLYIIGAFATLSSCTLKIDADGSRTYGLDPQAAAVVTTAIIESDSGK